LTRLERIQRSEHPHMSRTERRKLHGDIEEPDPATISSSIMRATQGVMAVEPDFATYAAARWASLVRSAVFLGCSKEEAQDIAQVTLLRCYVSWAKVKRADDRDAYVYRVLLNCLRDSRRRRWWGERPTERLPETEAPDITSDVDVADAVHRALAGLSKPHRDVVVLRFFANLSEQQTAHALGVGPGTVKSRLSRALAKLSADSHLLDLTEGNI
jgi:RNA polymerase sigma-70 factor (sigma-E family)